MLLPATITASDNKDLLAKHADNQLGGWTRLILFSRACAGPTASTSRAADAGWKAAPPLGGC